MWWWWDSTTNYRPYANTWLTTQVPWYSRALNDFMKPLPQISQPGNWLNSVDYSQWFTNRLIGTKKYELTDHLGNVQSVIYDRHTPLVHNGQTKRYAADVFRTLEYYPYGMHLKLGNCLTCPPDEDTSIVVAAQSMQQTWTTASLMPTSYPPQTGSGIGSSRNDTENTYL